LSHNIVCILYSKCTSLTDTILFSSATLGKCLISGLEIDRLIDLIDSIIRFDFDFDHIDPTCQSIDIVSIQPAIDRFDRRSSGSHVKQDCNGLNHLPGLRLVADPNARACLINTPTTVVRQPPAPTANIGRRITARNDMTQGKRAKRINAA
jgi:hypothetical protein